MANHWHAVDEGTWAGTYSHHGNPINMFVVDLGQKQLAVFSPGKGVDASMFGELDTLGKVVALVSPGAYHNEGMPSWHVRYPDAKLYATASGLTRIKKLYPALPALAPASELAALSGGSVATYETPGKHGDLLVFVTRGQRVTLFNCEYLINWDGAPAKLLFRLMFKWTNSVPGVRVAKPASWFLGANVKDVSRFCQQKIEAHGVTSFVPCHGVVVRDADVRSRIEQAIQARLAE